MIFIPEKEAPITTPTFVDSLKAGLPRAYAILFFCANPRFGWWLMAVGLLAPKIALCGLFGAVAAAALSWLLGYDRTLLRTGYSLFNPMLICLTVGWLNHCHGFSPSTLMLLLSTAAAGGFFLSTAMGAWMQAHFGISTHSLPSVVGSYVLYLMAHSLFGPTLPPVQGAVPWMELPFLPPIWLGLFQAFGSMVFQAQALPGMLVFIGLASTSPLTTLVACAAYFSGSAVLWQLGIPPEMVGSTLGGYNFLLCGIALGASYYITSGASLSLAFLGAALCAFLGLAINSALLYFALPPSALPYNLVLLVLLYGLGQRAKAGALVPSPAPGALPEAAARQVLLHARRFPDLLKPALSLPFEGDRFISQGFGGPLTHRGKWQHALDFETQVGGSRNSGSGESLTDFHLFGTPVLAPISGVIAYVENHVPDNAPGMNNPDQNWGNCVIIYSDGGYYVLLAHLKHESVTVAVGQRVLKGASLGECGNSGRSPVPHLHLQIQPTGWFGAPTRPFCIKHYIDVSADGGPVYHTSGVPDAGSTVRSSSMSASLMELFGGLLPGEYRYRLTADDGRSWEESVRLDFDEWGRYRFRSRRHGAQLSAFVSEGVFYAVDYSGPGESVLALMGAGLARVPCLDASDVSWFDGVSTMPFSHSVLRPLLELVEPFLGPFMLRFRYRMENEHVGGVAVQANSVSPGEATAPKEIICGIQPRRGVVRIEARQQNDHFVKAVQTDYQPVCVP